MNGPQESLNLYTNEELDALPALDGADEEAWELLLTRALHPVAPPADFAEVVLRRAGVGLGEEFAGKLTYTAVPVNSADAISLTPKPAGLRDRWRKLQDSVRAWPGFVPQAWGAGALAAAALALAVFAGQQNGIRHEQERALAERRAAANQQFDASVRILDRTLEHTRDQLRRAGVSGLE